MEELQKMMLVALVYRILVCFYEVSFLKEPAPSCKFCVCSLYAITTLSPFLHSGHLHLGSRRSHSREVSHWTPSCHMWLIGPGSTQQGSCGASNECLFICVSVFLSQTYFGFLLLCLSYQSSLFSSAGQLSEPWTRTFPSPSFSRPSSHFCSSSTIGLCMIWWLGPLW